MKQRNGYWKPEFFVAAAQTSKNELYFCSILYPWYWFDSCMHSAFSGKLRHWDGMIREKENNKYYLWSLEFTDLTISAIANPQVHRRGLICWQNSATVPSWWLEPSKGIRPLQYYNRVNSFWGCHFPPAIRGWWFTASVDPDRSLLSSIIFRSAHVKNEGLHTWVLRHGPCVKCICSIISFSIPIKKGSCRSLKLSRRDDSPPDLNNIAPWDWDGPVPILVIADGLLHYASWIKLRWLEQVLESSGSAHAREYWLHYIDMMKWSQWSHGMGCQKA